MLGVDGPPEPLEVAEQWTHELGDLDTTPFLLVSTVQRLRNHLERAFTCLAKEYELRPADLRVLLALRRSGPDYALSPTALFRQLMITSGAVSKQIDQLADLGLVTRVADPNVLRGLLVRLEPAGREIAERAMREICSSYCGLETLDGEQARDMLAALRVLTDVVERSAL
ncbi:MAG TPA: MarR family transcriptional regulator [Pseudonocardiaceae bacterium]|jgi:DNA-binding MarR family transcriptional regulator|nr:MarR family transcriptional regulator [Pseudonocardiaceae bacterium]